MSRLRVVPADEPGRPRRSTGGRHPVHGWGRFPVIEAEERFAEDLEAVTEGAILTRGLGRSYGDASLPPSGDHVVANATAADRIRAFDPDTGVLRAEAGYSLRDLIRAFLPRRWVTPVTPGTQHVTLGGMVASDVHGKNHHVAGTIGEHVRSLRLRVADGRILEVNREHEPELFRATIAGMGLTGHILEVELQLSRIEAPWIFGDVERARDLDELLAKQRAASREWPYTVSWVDCLAGGGSMGRGVVHKGRWATRSEAPTRAPKLRPLVPVPIMLPELALTAFTCRLANLGYYHNPFQPTRPGIRHPQSFFYPLDVLHEWHRIYGRSGMSQYQCVLPVDGDDFAVVRRFFETLVRSQVPSFLSVVKDCGPEGTGMLSFPRPGISVALDLPIRGSGAAEVVARLNEIVIEAGGRIYLAKDALTAVDHFRAMEPRLDGWNAVRRAWDPEALLRSALSVRLLGDEP